MEIHYQYHLFQWLLSDVASIKRDLTTERDLFTYIYDKNMITYEINKNPGTKVSKLPILYVFTTVSPYGAVPAKWSLVGNQFPALIALTNVQPYGSDTVPHVSKSGGLHHQHASPATPL